jgi:hypothetical protein
MGAMNKFDECRRDTHSLQEMDDQQVIKDNNHRGGGIVTIVQHHVTGIPIHFPKNRCETALVHQEGALRADL